MSKQTGRELLELAALAAGIHIDKSTTNGGGMNNTGFDLAGNVVLDWHNGVTWNPLTDDGDALRLAVKLKLEIGFGVVGEVYAFKRTDGTAGLAEPFAPDPCAATRRAIVRAAAQVGQSIQGAK